MPSCVGLTRGYNLQQHKSTLGTVCEKLSFVFHEVSTSLNMVGGMCITMQQRRCYDIIKELIISVTHQ